MKTVVLPYILVKIMVHFLKKIKKNSVYLIIITIIKPLTLTFDQFNVSLLNKINFLKIFTDFGAVVWM